MADPRTTLGAGLTPINYSATDDEIEVFIRLIESTGLGTLHQVIDLAVERLSAWYGIPCPPGSFDMGKRAVLRSQLLADARGDGRGI